MSKEKNKSALVMIGKDLAKGMEKLRIPASPIFQSWGYKIHYSRWPEVDEDYRNLAWDEGVKKIWSQYSHVLGNGAGIQALQGIQNQLEHELDTVNKELEKISEDTEEWKRRLSHSQFTFEFRLYVIQRLLTHYSVKGEIEPLSDEQASHFAQPIRIENIINKATRSLRKANKKKGAEFMRIYAAKKTEFPNFNRENFIEEIGWTDHAPNTQRDWMDKYDEEEKDINDLLSDTA